MGTRQDSPDSQGNRQTAQRHDFGELPDLDDLLMLADVDESDAVEAVAWMEDNAPAVAARISSQ